MDTAYVEEITPEKLEKERTLLIDRWKLFAEASHNEKKWMHERLNWLLVSQPILFTALSFSTQFGLTSCSGLGDITNLCIERRQFVFWLPNVIVTVGLHICCLVLVTLIAAGRMHWKWTSVLNDISSKITELEKNPKVPSFIPPVPFGAAPYWPARTSSFIAPLVGLVFVVCWLVLVRLLADKSTAIIAITGAFTITLLSFLFAAFPDRRNKKTI